MPQRELLRVALRVLSAIASGDHPESNEVAQLRAAVPTSAALPIEDVAKQIIDFALERQRKKRRGEP